MITAGAMYWFNCRLGSILLIRNTPPIWDVQSEMVAIFGGVDDKRQIKGVHLDPNKVLILDGTCIFGGIEIMNLVITGKN